MSRKRPKTKFVPNPGKCDTAGLMAMAMTLIAQEFPEAGFDFNEYNLAVHLTKDQKLSSGAADILKNMGWVLYREGNGYCWDWSYTLDVPCQ